MERPNVRARTTSITALGIAVALAVVPFIGPSPVGADAPLDVFSAERAMTHVREIAREPHPMGSPENARVGAYLAEQLESAGWEVQPQRHTVSDFYGSPGRRVEITNVVARLRGTASTGAVALVAHYDSVPWTPGANDNAAAVAALVETARLLPRIGGLRNDILIVATDAEEPSPRSGVRAFVNGHPWADSVAVAVNFEAAGSGGPVLMVESTGPNAWLIEAYAEATEHPAAYSFLTDLVGRIGEIGTDFDVFRAQGTPGLHLAYSHGAPIYHTMRDHVGAVGRRSLQHHGDYAVGLAIGLGGLDLADPPSGDVVHFAVGRRLIRYAPIWGHLALAASLVGFGLVVRRRPSRLPAAQTVAAAGRSFGGALGVAVVAVVVWIGVVALRPTLGIVEGYVYLALLLLLTAVVADAAHRRTASERDRMNEFVAIAAIWLALALVFHLVAPQTGYLFLWPAAGAVAALAILDRTTADGWRGPGVVTALVAIPAAVIMVPAIDVFFQFAQPRPGNPDSEMAFMIGFPVLLGGLTVDLVRRGVAAGQGRSRQSLG